MKHTSTSHESETDMERLRAMKDSDIRIDDDAPAWTQELFAGSIIHEPVSRAEQKPLLHKTLLPLSIDVDVFEWFRSQGQGYQSRINDLLKEYMLAHQSSGSPNPA